MGSVMVKRNNRIKIETILGETLSKASGEAPDLSSNTPIVSWHL